MDYSPFARDLILRKKGGGWIDQNTLVHRIVCTCDIIPSFRSGLGEHIYPP